MPKLRPVPPSDAVEAVLHRRHIDASPEVNVSVWEEIEEDIEAATPALHEKWEADQKRAIPPDVCVQLKRQLGWLQIIFGSFELNAYWQPPTCRRRWQRFSLRSQGVVVGPLTALYRLHRHSGRRVRSRLSLIKGSRRG
jgi:hypothetical protein